VLVSCLESAGGLILDENLFLLEPGDVFLIFPHQCHQLVRFEKEAISWLFITFEMEEIEAILPLRNNPFRVTSAVGDSIKRVVGCYEAGLRGENTISGDIAAELSLLLSALLRQQGRGGPVDRLGKAGQADYTREMVRRVTKYIYGNIGRPVRLTEIARHASISESHLRRVFRQALGLSLGEFIRHTRINKACGLLHKSELNVTQVAEACGFGSLYAFSSAFRKQVGLAPLHYRRKVRGV
jgi:AraC-like DNA-binding protein